jgi:DNA repair protein RadC
MEHILLEHVANTIERPQLIRYSDINSPMTQAIQQHIRPREKLLCDGAQALSDQELLAVILNVGTKGLSVMELAAKVLEHMDFNSREQDIRKMQAISGMGNAQISKLAAVIEFGRRHWGPHGLRVQSPEDVYPLIRHFADRSQERFIAISLDGGHEVLGIRLVTVGLVNRTIVHPREVYSDPIKDRACALIVAHNHPSGRLEPSQEDREITKRLAEAGEILGISLLDHLIIGQHGFLSFIKEGLL